MSETNEYNFDYSQAIELMKANPMADMVSNSGGIIRYNDNNQIYEFKSGKVWRCANLTSWAGSSFKWLGPTFKPTDEYEECEPKDAEIVRSNGLEFVVDRSRGFVLQIDGIDYRYFMLKPLGVTFHRKKEVKPVRLTFIQVPGASPSVVPSPMRIDLTKPYSVTYCQPPMEDVE